MNGNRARRSYSHPQIPFLYRRVAFLSGPYHVAIEVLMRITSQCRQGLRQTVCGLLLAGICSVVPGKVYATVTVYFSTGAAHLQNDFIMQTTTQYNVNLIQVSKTVFKAYISGTNNWNPINTATAVDRCMTYGFVEGIDSEREENLTMLSGFIVDASSTGKCGGLVNTSTTTQKAYISGCIDAYNHAASTITQRNGLAPKILP